MTLHDTRAQNCLTFISIKSSWILFLSTHYNIVYWFSLYLKIRFALLQNLVTFKSALNELDHKLERISINYVWTLVQQILLSTVRTASHGFSKVSLSLVIFLLFVGRKSMLKIEDLEKRILHKRIGVNKRWTKTLFRTSLTRLLRLKLFLANMKMFLILANTQVSLRFANILRGLQIYKIYKYTKNWIVAINRTLYSSHRQFTITVLRGISFGNVDWKTQTTFL